MTSDEPTVLGMIYNTVSAIDRKLDNVCEKQVDMMLTDEIIKAKVAAVELQNIKNAEDILILRQRQKEHERDRETHFSPYHNESLRQKLWRKKPEIAAGGGVGALIYLIIELIKTLLENGGM